jgi:multiple antibiotic resistance protein
MDSFRLGMEAFVTLFVIMDPPGTAPIFLSLVGGKAVIERRRLAMQAAAVAFAVITTFALFGQAILSYLSISVEAMQGAGGLLLLLVALELLTGKAENPVRQQGVNVALVPLGTPLLAGPGAIVATIILVQRIDSTWDAVALASAVIAVHLSLWLILRGSVGMVKVLRESGVMLIARISGLLVSAIAVQMIADAVRSCIHS